MKAPRDKASRIPLPVLRTALLILIAAVFMAGTACRAGYGTLCALHLGNLSIVCPLGFLSAAFASKRLLPGLWPAVGAAVGLIIVFGRVFCAWVCPASLLHRLAANQRWKALRWPSTKKNDPKRLGTRGNGGLDQPAPVSNPQENRNVYSSLAVLAGALASSYLFGFPVFCLICPVGLMFGTMFAAVRWATGSMPGIELVIFPLILFAEFFVLKSWCSSFCPLGALHGLLGRLNRSLRIEVKKDACLVERGINCRVCEKACPQGMSLARAGNGSRQQLCTKCMECYEKCPTKAIQLKAL